MKNKKKIRKTTAAVKAYTDTGNKTDPMGMYTGVADSERDSISDEQYRPFDESVRPEQDADDL